MSFQELDAPVIVSITKRNNIADEVRYEVRTRYGNDYYMTLFIGSLHGNPGPVLMKYGILGDSSTWVMGPSQYGAKLDEQWIRNFYEQVGQ